MLEARQGETEEKTRAASGSGAGSSAPEVKQSAADEKKPAEDAKKPAKKKKIIIVTGGNTQGGQRGAYSSGTGAYTSGGNGGRGPRNGAGGRRGSGSGQAAGGKRPGDSRSGRQGGRSDSLSRGGSDRGGRQGGGRGRTQSAAPVHKLIKPTIRQTQMEVDYHKPVQQPRKSDAVRRAEEEAAAAAAKAAAEAAAAKAAEAAAEEAKAEAASAAAAEKPAGTAPAAQAQPAAGDAARRDAGRTDRKPQDGSRQQRSNDRSGDRGPRQDGGAGRNGRGSSDGRGQRQGSDARGGRGGARPGQGAAGGGRGGARPGQGAARGGNAGFGQDKSRGKSHGEKDRRSRKDQIYNEDEKNRKNRSGRFIRPEKKEEVPAEEQIKTISVPEKISIRELAERMHMQPAEIIKKLFLQGKAMTPNSEVSYEEAEEIALGYDILCEKEQVVDVIEELLREDEEDEADMVSRPPVICVMGHVDHGKTSLLDAIRSTNVTGKEAGGITQAIGAYMVSVNGRDITFLDTPGHEAFTAMRMRGANSTDIAILVVAADDGVMPQTIEAINHAKAAGVEIIVAINKIDKDGANPDRVKQELTEYELIPTDWGGSTEFVEVSAKRGDGIEDLLETILLTADIMELKANPDRKARGLVLEAKLDKGRGPVANVLVQKGTLHIGDFISAGASSGKVRAMIDDKGRRVKEAKPSHPVEILGLSDVPSAGEVFLAHEDLQTAKSYAEAYKVQRKEELIEETRMRMNLDDLFSQMKEGTLKEFNLILKADVQGSVEALRQSLLKLSNEEVVVKVIHAAVGNINESDVSLASASNAVIIGFNVRPDMMAKSMADQENVDIRLYKVIYQAIDAIEAALKGMRAPVYEERVIGHAEVRQLFKASRVGNIAGSMVIDGIIRRGCSCRIRRGEEQIYEGNLASLKRFKDDVKEVREGFDCGLVFEGFDKMQVGDIVEAYDLVEVPRD
ncbi:MAG: translation initiation factor IF-2 [Lachnospiraceae bacterium]|nr:translation initiation factor IF-2 [Lachnospiraceae bacterium]